MIARFILILFFLPFGNLIGQTVQLGSGTVESSNYESSPVNIYYRRTVCQFVYTAAELQAAGMPIGSPITQIGFYVTQAPIYNIPGYRIRIKHVAQSNVATAIPNGGWTTLVNGITYAPTAGGFDMLNVSGTFQWDGVSNIGIEICWSRVNPNFNASGKVRIIPTTSGYRYSWTDANGNSCGNTPATVTTSRPQLQMVFVPGTSTTWTGAISTNWFTSGNWTAGIPTDKMDAVIPAGLTNYPIISGTAKCRALNAAAATSVTVNNSSQLISHGDFTCSGTLTCNGELRLSGTNAVNFSIPVNTQIYDLRILNPAGVTFTGGTALIRNAFMLEGGAFAQNNQIILLSDAAGTARIPRIKNPCTFSLQMNDSYGDGWNGGYLTLSIDGIVTAYYAASGSGQTEYFTVPDGSTFTLTYTAGSYENENSYTLRDGGGSVLYNDPAPPATGLAYSGSANCSFINPLTNPVEARRHIDAGATNWRFLTFPVAGANLEQFDDDFITSGIPGSDYPTWPTPSNPWRSLWFYNETAGTTYSDGYYPPTNMTDVPQTGQGIWIWCGDTITGTQPFLIDAFGSINAGNINLPVTYTPAAGNPTDDGWNMVANPYPCTIDWLAASGWTKTNIDDALYIWNPDLQQYAAYVGGIGVNAGDRYIAPWQAFMVHSNSASPVLTARERVKINQEAAFLKSPVLPSELIRLNISFNGISDETVIRFHSQATHLPDPNLDALQFTNFVAEAPHIASVWQGNKFAINALPLISGSISIPILVTTPTAGTGVISATNLTAAGHCLLLEDTYTGTFTNLLTTPVYSFTHSDTTLSPRFLLHLHTEVSAEASPVTCSGAQDGALYIPYEGNYNVTNTLGQNVFSANQPDSVLNLPSGNYFISSTGFCGTFTDTTFISAPYPLDAIINLIPSDCDTCCNALLNILPEGGIPPYQITVDSNSAPINLPIAVCAGLHTITITDANNCIWEYTLNAGTLNSQFTQVSTIKCYPNPASEYFILEGVAPHSMINMVDMAGKSVEIFTESRNGLLMIPVRQISSGKYFLHINSNGQQWVHEIQILHP